MRILNTLPNILTAHNEWGLKIEEAPSYINAIFRVDDDSTFYTRIKSHNGKAFVDFTAVLKSIEFKQYDDYDYSEYERDYSEFTKKLNINIDSDADDDIQLNYYVINGVVSTKQERKKLEGLDWRIMQKCDVMPIFEGYPMDIPTFEDGDYMRNLKEHILEYDAEATPPRQRETINECGIMLKWRNTFGAYSYWLFKSKHQIHHSVKKLGILPANEVSDITDELVGVNLGYEHNVALELSAIPIDKKYIEEVITLISSPEVYILENDKYERVTLEAQSYKFNSNSNTYYLKVKVSREQPQSQIYL
ncbi:hypothetical protein ACQ1PF_07900 [Ornithobacterium rhinotracheale]